MDNNIEKNLGHNKSRKKPKRTKWFILGFLTGLVFCVLSYYCIKNDVLSSYLSRNKTEASNISSEIREMNELVTAELEYQSVLEIKDENAEKWHALFTSKQMLLLYKAKISAGVDLTNAIVENNTDKVIVKIPHATIKHKEIDTDSLKVYNTKLALPLVSVSDEDLLLDALKRVEEDMEHNANTSNIIDFADKQAIDVIEQFVHSTIENAIVKVEFTNEININNQIIPDTNETTINSNNTV